MKKVLEIILVVLGVIVITFSTFYVVGFAMLVKVRGIISEDAGTVFDQNAKKDELIRLWKKILIIGVSVGLVILNLMTFFITLNFFFNFL